MIYKKNLFMHVGLIVSLLGIALYDPLGSIYKGAGLMVLAIGLVCFFLGINIQLSMKQLIEPLKISKRNNFGQRS